MAILDTIAGSRFAYQAGTGTADVDVPSGSQVLSASCSAASGAGATLVITPGGANQTGTAGNTITIPAGKSWSENFLGQIGGGTRFAFTSTDAYYVSYFLPRG